MEKIKEIKVTRFLTGLDGQSQFDGYIEVTAKFILDLPVALSGVTNIAEIAESYANIFGIEKVELGKVYFSAKIHSSVFKSDLSGVIDDEDVKQMLLDEYAIYVQRLDSFTLLPFDSLIGKTWDGVAWI